MRSAYETPRTIFFLRAVWRRVAENVLRLFGVEPERTTLALTRTPPTPEDGLAAYDRLRRIFGAWQSESDQIDILQAEKWLASNEALDSIVADIKGRRHNQFRLLNSDRYHVDTLLDQADSIASALPDWDQANLQEMRRLHDLSSGLTHPELIDALEDALKHSESQWLETFELSERDGPRAAWAAQQPILENIFSLRRQLAAEPARRLGVAVSEVLLDEWNPHTRNSDIDRAIESAKTRYPHNLQGLAQELRDAPPPLPLPDVAEELQQKLFRHVLNAFLDAGGWDQAQLDYHDIEIDFTTLPNGFCWGTPNRIKLAIECYEDDVIRGLSNAMHECGHLLYLLALNRLPDAVKSQPVGRVNGYNTHEAAAMFFEQAGYKKRFFAITAPLIRSILHVDGPEWAPENLHALATRPDPHDMNWGTSELALPPNMAWRVLAERRILDEEMRVADLPRFWAETMQQFTGQPHDPDDFMVAESHWFDRQMGYFWAYQTGAIAASALHDALARDTPGLDQNAATLADYLRPYATFIEDRVFAQAGRFRPLILLEMASGTRPSMRTYLDRLARLAEPGTGLQHSTEIPLSQRERAAPA